MIQQFPTQKKYTELLRSKHDDNNKKISNPPRFLTVLPRQANI